jgi:cytoplasmic iron level regulating protein YaaA (DUF328/UPF0246 family)
MLLHSSKTMRQTRSGSRPLHRPLLLDRASKLASYLKTLSPAELMKVMHISDSLSRTTHQLLEAWTNKPDAQLAAIDSFLGDIYSGLRPGGWSESDRLYADEHLYILSGLYGILRPLDGIYPYRLELGYKLPSKHYANLYNYWADSVAECLPPDEVVINLSSQEYSKVVLPYIDPERIITPTFLSIHPTTSKPTFVAVHAKIARGAFANWVISKRITGVQGLSSFDDLGYRINHELSEADAPVYICRDFGGKGLSVRLQQ